MSLCPLDTAVAAGTVETLVKPGNKALLTAILLLHVLPGAPRLSRQRAIIIPAHAPSATAARQPSMVAAT